MTEASPPPPPPQDVPEVQQGNVYEMLWDCEYCGTAKLLGKTHRFCPNCGAAQNPEARYFPSDDEKVAVKDHVYVGVDRVCSSCQVPNSAIAEFCVQCGSPLTDAALAKRQEAESRGEGERFQQGQRAKGSARSRAKPPPQGKDPYIWVKVIGGIFVFLIAMSLLDYLWTEAHEVQVTGHSWVREIEIESYAPRSDDGWCDSMPARAYNVSRSSKVRSYRDVADGQTCSTERIDQGDGTYREVERCSTRYRQEPIYDDYCSYTVDRWGYARSVKAAAADRAPHWPRFTLSRVGQCMGCEREGPHRETYTLTLEDAQAQKTYPCAVDLSLWQQAEPGSLWRIDVGVMDKKPRCGSLVRPEAASGGEKGDPASGPAR